MKVICAGMSKCGTKTLHYALEEIGYKVYDFPEAYIYFEENYKKFVGKGWDIEEFRLMYENVDAVVDSPTYYFWEELMQAFPEAKVILMMRENDEVWYKSIRKQLLSLNGVHRYYYPFLSATWRQFISFASNECMVPFATKRRSLFDVNIKEPSNLAFKLAYRKHIAHVMHTCPKDRLLIYNCKSGWKPLCEFLDKSVPNKQFPWINKDGELAKMVWQTPMLKQARKEVITKVALAFIGFVGAGFYLFKYK